MFTGLIQEIGTIKDIKYGADSIYLTITCQKVLIDLKIGDSIAINGVCQTVIEFDNNTFKVFVSAETLNVTTLGSFELGQYVNLERTLRVNDRLDGHIVSGHVDCLGAIKDIKKNHENTTFTIEFPSKIAQQIVNKGSVSLDGISLTVINVTDKTFDIALIPHTLKSTNLQYKKIGDKVNIETDVIAKYVEKYLSSNNNSSNITMDLLERNGFL